MRRPRHIPCHRFGSERSEAKRDSIVSDVRPTHGFRDGLRTVDPNIVIGCQLSGDLFDFVVDGAATIIKCLAL
jgi:hypothetical protein